MNSRCSYSPFKNLRSIASHKGTLIQWKIKRELLLLQWKKVVSMRSCSLKKLLVSTFNRFLSSTSMEQARVSFTPITLSSTPLIAILEPSISIKAPQQRNFISSKIASSYRTSAGPPSRWWCLLQVRTLLSLSHSVRRSVVRLPSATTDKSSSTPYPRRSSSHSNHRYYNSSKLYSSNRLWRANLCRKAGPTTPEMRNRSRRRYATRIGWVLARHKEHAQWATAATSALSLCIKALRRRVRRGSLRHDPRNLRL